ncbi:MAG: RsmB/NOP family class I SAM-dependent RNA methyltransferase [Acutalibacteraceae bacterium]|nr:RsmF rRNA methyltransferase first C-terminal domain-containing protein [Clostridiales bacterium]MEE0157879.1 RsmB/NOP family class I SAM-dependent RNA methyltransferase [Acutalibacteraceae bacterium]
MAFELPLEFENRMRGMLGGEYEAFRAEYEKPHRRGIRLNTLKCDAQTLAETLPFPLVPSPFSPLSYYAPADARMAAYPLYHAGAFYSQEPSASSAVTLLDPQPGERVLDLCAAPGGKSTQIAALTQDRGLLWSNEVVRSRASVLASNLERMGVKNAVVSSVYPDVLAEKLAGYFDRVLVDAPCSGEGMFRRDPAAVQEWSPAHVETCAVRQLAILKSAARCVRAGGVLVYSTCTFSAEENEGVVRAFLAENPGFVLEKPAVSFGRPAYGLDAVRIFPMDGGEGHFAARFRYAAENACAVQPHAGQADRQTAAAARALYNEIFEDAPPEHLARVRDRILLLPAELPALSGLGVLRAGVELGELRKNRIEPAHGMFMAAKAAQCRSVLHLRHDDPRLLAFLRGEEITAEGGSGYTAVAAEGVVTGFGKASGGVLKNKYPKGLRIRA